MLVSDFDYELPEELIAQEPLAERAGSRLLHLKCGAGQSRSSLSEECIINDRQFREFPGLLQANDLVVFNNTRVFPARLYGRRSGLRSQPVSTSNRAARDFLRGRIEVLLTRQVQQEPNEWECLVRPGRKIGVGETLFFGEHDELQAQVIGRGSFGERRIRFAQKPEGTPTYSFFDLVEKIGHIPLPPYIAREDSWGRSRALPDGLCAGARIGRSSYCGIAFH